MANEKQGRQMNVPRHLAIIPDGNRRWAKARGLPAFKGHEAGLKKFKEILEWCKELGIKILTLYTFSTENFSRSKEEVAFLMKMIKGTLQDFINDKNVHKGRVRLNVLGDLNMLPEDVKKIAIKAKEATKGYDAYTLNLAIAYGGRQEIVHAAKEIAKLVKAGRLDMENIDERISMQNCLMSI